MKEKGFTLIELMIVIAIIAVIAAIAIPNLAAARKSANETSAVASLRTLSSAQTIYRERQTGSGVSYATNLTQLEDLIDQNLQSGGKSGFSFALTGGSFTWTATAMPQDTSTGTRGFFIDNTGLIRVTANHHGKAADSASDAL